MEHDRDQCSDQRRIPEAEVETKPFRAPVRYGDGLDARRASVRARHRIPSRASRASASPCSASARSICVIAGQHDLLCRHEPGFVAELAPRRVRSRSGFGCHARPDIVDRNGEVLATDVRTVPRSLPSRASLRKLDVDEATELLTAVLPDLDQREVRDRLALERKGFVWLKREITPRNSVREIHRLGIPGIGFRKEAKRVYPNGPVLSHVIGHVNVDNQGIAGIEKYIDTSRPRPLHRAGFKMPGRSGARAAPST